MGRLRPCRRATRPYRKGGEGGPGFRRQGGERPGVRAAGYRQNRVLQDPGRPVAGEPLQRRRSGRQGRGTPPGGTAAGASSRSEPAGSGQRVDPAFRRDGGPALGPGFWLDTFPFARLFPAPVRRLQGIPQPPAGTHPGADPLDFELRQGDVSHRPAAHDLRPGASAAHVPGPGADMDPGAGPPRNRSNGGERAFPRTGVRGGSGGGVRGNRCRDPLRWRPRRGAPRGAQPVPGDFGGEAARRSRGRRRGSILP